MECWINIRPLYQYLNAHQIAPRDILLSTYTNCCAVERS